MAQEDKPAMKYHAWNQINRILKLQQKTRELRDEIRESLNEADVLAEQMIGKHGEQFVCKGVAYKFEYAAIGHGVVGNRQWLRVDKGVKVLRHGD